MPQPRRGIRLIEVLIVIAIIVLLFSIFLPWLNRARETGGHIRCASNLRQIGQAMLLYATDNGGHYPRTVYVPGKPPVYGTNPTAIDPFKDGGPEANDVTASIFLLLRTQDITAEVFTCPSSNQEKDVYGGSSGMPANRSNFSDVKKNLSYAMQNPYPEDEQKFIAADKNWWTSHMGDHYALFADRAPDDTAIVTATQPALVPDSPPKDLKRANSRAHDGDGQFVLWGDGHVTWESSPFVGIDRDNIFRTRSGLTDAPPAEVRDNVLVPSDE
jgi:type II secretory pathway pseudopilin PulG